MIRFMLENNNVEIFDFYDKYSTSDIPNNDISTSDISNNDISNNNILLYESDSDYSEMYALRVNFEYVDISNIDMILNNKIDKNVEEMAMNNEKDKNVEEMEINNETGILTQSFYNLGKRLFNYSPI